MGYRAPLGQVSRLLYLPSIPTLSCPLFVRRWLAGRTGVIVIFMIFLYRGIRIALKTKDDFAALTAAGLTALLSLQSFIILAGVTKMLPLTGVTLPFMSYGGSSLLANFILLGLLLNVSHEAENSL